MWTTWWLFLFECLRVISKLIKPYHCCVYGSFCHICSCINANKDVWLVLSGMMAISSGKKCSQFCCAVVVQEQRLILCLSCFIVLNEGLFSCCGLCSKKLHSPMMTHFFVWEKRLRCYGDSKSPYSWVPFVFSMGFFAEGIMREFYTKCCVFGETIV